MSSPSNGKVALVTGATRGIGRAVVVQLANDGFDISFCYKSSEDAARALAAEVTDLGRRVFCQRCDVSDALQVERFMHASEEKLGEPDAVVNNAGVRADNPLVLLNDEQWNSVLRTNLDSLFHVTRRALFSMMKRKAGSVVSVSSVSGVYGNPGQANYSAAKAGIIGFSKTVAKEMGPYGVRVNVVAPGWIETDMTSDLPQKVVDRVMPNIPLRRLGQPQDVADLVSFLVSDKARYITAQCIQVDGGVMI